MGCFGTWTALLFGAGALYASLTVGVTGGPNKGEHPFLVTVLHAGCFAFLARGWSRSSWWAYAGLLALTLAFTVWAMGLTGERRAWKLWSARGLLLALHGAMAAVAIRGAAA